MMNVGIIFPPRHRNLRPRAARTPPMRHCLTTRRPLIRGDGCTAREATFDLEPANSSARPPPGCSGDSCWSRGLAWSLYGFGTAYRCTRDRAVASRRAGLRRLLHRPHARRRCAAVGLRCAQRQQSAGRYFGRSHAASGLLQLAHLVADRIRGRFYETVARRILSTLSGVTWPRTTPTGKAFSRAAHPRGEKSGSE